MAQHEQPDWRSFVMDANGRAATSLPPAPMATTVAPSPPIGTGFPSPPAFDPIERLPDEQRKERLRAMRDRRSEKHAAMIPHDELREAIAERTLAEQNLRRLQAHAQDGGFALPPTDARVIASEQQVARTSDNARRLQERSDKLAAAWRAAAAPVVGCEDWLRHGVPANCRIEPIEVEPPRLAKGENPIDGIFRLQRRGREIKASIHAIRSSRFPTSYCKRRAREQVEPLEQRGAISVSRLVELDGDIEFPSLQLRAMVHNATPGAVAFHEAVDVVGLIAFIFKDALIAALDREIDAEGDDAGSLSHEERQQREAEAQSDLMSVELDEAALTWSAMEQGLPVEFRADISPLAILQVQLVTVPRATELPPSSPERAGFNLIGGRR